MKKFLLAIAVCLTLASSSQAFTVTNMGKSAPSLEFMGAATRLGTTASSSAHRPSLRFDSFHTTTGARAYGAGFVPPTAATTSYEVILRVYYTTGASQTGRVGLDTTLYAVLPWDATDAGPERVADLTTTELNSGTVRSFVNDQIQYVTGPVTIQKPNGDPCDSDCNNRQMVFLLEPSSLMSINSTNLYILGWDIYYVH